EHVIDHRRVRRGHEPIADADAPGLQWPEQSSHRHVVRDVDVLLTVWHQSPYQFLTTIFIDCDDIEAANGGQWGAPYARLVGRRHHGGCDARLPDRRPSGPDPC